MGAAPERVWRGPVRTRCLPRIGSRVLIVLRLGWPRPHHLEGYATEEAGPRSFHLVGTVVQVIQDGLIPRQPGLGHELHPRAVGGLVGGFGGAAPDRDVGVVPPPSG